MPGGADVGGDVLERGDDGLLLGRGADAGHRDGRLRRAAGLDQRLGGLADGADAGEQDERAVVGVRASSRPSSPQVTTAISRVALGGQRDAGVGRDRAHRGDAGDDLEADAGLDAGLRLLGAGGVEERVAGHQAHDALLLAVAYDDLGAGGVGERLAVLAEAAVDDLRAVPLAVRALGEAEDGADQVDVLGGLGDDDLGAREELHGTHGQQARVAGPLPTNDTQPGVATALSVAAGLRGLYSRHACCVPHWWCVHQVCCSVVEHVARESSAELSASATGPVALIRTDRPPSVGEGHGAQPQLLPVLALDDLGQGADRGGATGLEGGEHGALGGDRGTGGGVVERGQGGARGRCRRRGTRRRGHPGRGRAASGAGRAPR